MHAIINTRQGDVRGGVDGGIYVFKGVPYAAPPFGANRLQAPRPVAPWSGVRDALEYGPKAPQPPYPPQVLPLIPPELCTAGEDCLNLNVWTDLERTGQPVMVWIPGGMFQYHATGASPWYDGTNFARDGVVCVTINYRVGIDGFLALSDGEPNRGLLDQIAALEWVRENIGAFGGDPDNVTIFGESAGALSIATLLAMPRAEGLFRRAIVQSGGAHFVLSAASARLVTESLARKLGIEPTRKAFSAVPFERLFEAQAELEADLNASPDPQRWGAELALSRMLWQPVIDGDVLPAHPLDRIAAGAGAGIDLIVGTNLDEHRLFLVPFGSLDHVTPEALAAAMAAYGLPVKSALAVYRKAHPGASAGDLLAALQTDWYWRIPAIRLADSHVKSPAATYMYEFEWPSPQFDGRLGACHALDVPFVFDTLDNGTEALWGMDVPQKLADNMHGAWMAFARNGDCGWPEYDLGRRATLRFGQESRVVDDPRAKERALWEGVR